MPIQSFLPLFRRAADVVLPPLCLLCDVPVGTEQACCAACWPHLHLIAKPLCQRCGVPFPYAMEGEAVCATCAADAPDFHQARAALVYNDASKRLVLNFKHGDRTDTAPALARWLEGAGQEMIAAADVIVPVPLHYWRMLRRRYNQAALLAQKLAAITGKPCVADALQRKRATPPQGQKKRVQRVANVKGAFCANPRRTTYLSGKNILLIDDVVTTGATVNSCAKALRAAGASTISVLALARTVLAD